MKVLLKSCHASTGSVTSLAFTSSNAIWCSGVHSHLLPLRSRSLRGLTILQETCTSRRPQRKSRPKDAKNQANRIIGEITNGHQHTESHGSRQQANGQWTWRSMDTTPTAKETSKQYHVEAAKQHTEATRCNPYHRPSGGLVKLWWERTLGSRM